MIFFDSFSARLFFDQLTHFHDRGPAGASFSAAQLCFLPGQGGVYSRGAGHAASPGLGTQKTRRDLKSER